MIAPDMPEKKEKYTGFKCGQFVWWSGREHLFLGYTDAKRSKCMIADCWGNKIHVWHSALSTSAPYSPPKSDSHEK